MAYNLGPVKPHVKAAANEIGPRFGITTVYGFGPGSVTNSDHPKGLALDFMTSNKAKGDALAAYCIQNASRLSVKYIIWYRKIWQGGWTNYSGFNPHYDHVHVSFNAVAGTGSSIVPVGNPIANPLAPGLAILKDVNDGIGWITDPKNIARIAMFIIGLILIFIAVIGIASVKTAYSTVKGVVNG